jgi:hypothetical protein
MASSDPIHAVWHLGPAGGSQTSPAYPAGSYCAAWQEAFTTYIFAWLTTLGFDEFHDLAAWKGQLELLRTGSDDDDHVWHHCNSAPYQFAFAPAVLLAESITETTTTFTVQAPQNFYGISAPFDVRVTNNSEVMRVVQMDDATWTVERTTPKKANSGNVLLGDKYTADQVALACDANFFARPDKWPTMEGDPDGYEQLYTGKGDGSYASYLRGALTMLVKLGVEGASDKLAWLEGQMIPAATKGQYSWDRKWTQVLS